MLSGFKVYSLMTFEEVAGEREMLHDDIARSQAVVDSLYVDQNTQFRRWLANLRDEPISWRLIVCTDGVCRDERLARSFERDRIDRSYARLKYLCDCSQREADRAWKAANGYGRMRELPSRTYQPDQL